MLVPNLDGSKSKFILGERVAYSETTPAIGDLFFYAKSFWRRISLRDVATLESTIYAKDHYPFHDDPQEQYTLNACSHATPSNALGRKQ